MLPALAIAAPNLNGLYKGELGILEFNTAGTHVSGRLSVAGVCEYGGGEPLLLDGELEGNVLIGKVMLCQTGAACGQKNYPLLAFFNAVDGSLSGDVRLDPGCASPALKGSRLLLTLATAEDKARAKAPGSAASVARSKLNPKKNPELMLAAFNKGRKFAGEKDYNSAVQQFEVAIAYDETNWVAWLALGVAEFQRGHTRAAIEAYERSSTLARAKKQDNPDIYYNLACAFARLKDRKATLTHLRTAVKLGFAESEEMSKDEDLNRLLHDDAEFQKLVKDAWTLKNNSSARRGPL
jgi:tetratricopeptide (TPR) repeat protein